MKSVISILILFISFAVMAQESAMSDSTFLGENDVELYSLSRFEDRSLSSYNDTILTGVHLFNPVYLMERVPHHFSFYGTPILATEKRLKTGFSIGGDAFDSYLIEKNNFIINESRVPYAQVNYAFSIPKGQQLNLRQTHAVNDYLTLGFNYRRVTSLESYYVSQKSNIKDFGAYLHFRNKDRRYNSVVHFINNNIYVQESGGIQNTYKFNLANTSTNQLNDEIANIKEGSNSIKGRQYEFQHSYLLGSDTLIATSDSTYNRIFISNIRLSHKMGYDHKGYFYQDEGMLRNNIDSSYFYDQVVYTSSLIKNNGERIEFESKDSLGHSQYYNQIGLDWFKTKKDTLDSVNINNRFCDYKHVKTIKYYKYFVHVGLRNELNEVGFYYDNLYKGFHPNLSADFSLFYVFNQKHSLDLKMNKYLSGHNYDDHHYKLRYQVKLFNNRFVQNWSVVDVKNTPDYIYYEYRGNHSNWSLQHHQIKQQQWNLESSYKPSKTSLVLSQRSIKGFVYFDENLLAVQHEDTILVRSIQLDQKIDLKHFHLNIYGLYRHVNDTMTYRVPKLEFYSSLYFETKVFHKKMLLQLGFDTRYFTAYYANQYMPTVRAAYMQNDIRIGNYPVLDVFMNFKVDMARFFIRVNHINQYNRDNYYLVPNHPMASSTPFIEMGVNWKFLY